MTKVRYEIEVDSEMFPFAPGSEVVVRDVGDGDSTHWQLWKYIMYDVDRHYCYSGCSKALFDQCHPITTHSHLIGTFYHEDMPACEVCGKAQPDCVCDRAKEWVEWYAGAKRTMSEAFADRGVSRQTTTATTDRVTDQLTTITAERDKLRAELEALKAPKPAHSGEFEPFQKVLVRGRKEERRTTAFYGHPNYEKEGRHRCCGGIWTYVIPYEGNQHLLGTTDKPLKCTECGAVSKTSYAIGIGPVCKCGSDRFEIY